MKRTCPIINIKSHEQTSSEFPARWSGRHQVKMWITEIKYNHQLISYFKNLYR